jgi:NAD(P)-dependent dehydrogenase (short-subunit alcohol dehydrogenase family)
MKNKIAITGHTKGIGKAVADAFNDYEIVGFSRTNGYDISKESDRIKILKEAKDCDIFFNNAYHPTGQADLLNQFIKEWSGTSKTIINMSSKSVYHPKGMGHEEYVAAKKQLNDIVDSTMMSTHPNILNILVGLVRTDMTAPVFSAKMIDPLQLGGFIKDMIKYQNVLAVQQVVIDVPDQDWKDIRFL